MGKIILSLIVLVVSLNPCISIPSWDLPKSSNNKSLNSNPERDLLNFNRLKYHNQLLNTENKEVYNNKNNIIHKNNEGDLIQITRVDYEKEKERLDYIDSLQNKESIFYFLSIFIFALFAIVLFTHFIYLRKYKKLIKFARELKKENRKLKLVHENLMHLNSQLEYESENSIKQMEDLNHGNQSIRTQHEKMLGYNFNLERIIEKRTRQITELHQQLSIKNTQLEKFIYIISRKAIRPVASLKGLVYLLEKPLINTDDKDEFADRIKACVNEMEDLLLQCNKVAEKEKNMESSTLN